MGDGDRDTKCVYGGGGVGWESVRLGVELTSEIRKGV